MRATKKEVQEMFIYVMLIVVFIILGLKFQPKEMEIEIHKNFEIHQPSEGDIVEFDEEDIVDDSDLSK